MRIPFSSIVAISVLVGPCCSSPSGPTNSNGPTNPGGGAAMNYSLQLTAASTCPRTGVGAMPQRTFEFEVSQQDLELTFGLQQPFNGTPNSGDLLLRLTPSRSGVSGTLARGGLSADGVHTFFAYASQTRTGAAVVTGSSAGSGEFQGTFDGYVTFSVFRLSAGGECTATGHSWRLTPKG